MQTITVMDYHDDTCMYMHPTHVKETFENQFCNIYTTY